MPLDAALMPRLSLRHLRGTSMRSSRHDNLSALHNDSAAARIAVPKHPYLQDVITLILAHPFGPSGAFDPCIEMLVFVAGLLDGQETGDPETLALLNGAGLCPTDLKELGLWFDAKADE